MKIIIDNKKQRILVKDNDDEIDISNGQIIQYTGIYYKNFDDILNISYIETTFIGIVEKDRYLNPINSKLLIKNILDLPYVDVLHFGSWSQEIQDEFVFDNFIYGTKTPEEGIVIKHVTGERSKVAKVINPSYLIYGEKNNIGDSH